MIALIYGCGNNGRSVLNRLESIYGLKILAYIDEQVRGEYRGIKIVGLEKINELYYDKILISLYDYDEVKCIEDNLITIGVEKNKIVRLLYDPEYIEVFSDERSCLIRDCAMWMDEIGMEGAVAECGVYRGDSAKFINKYFYKRKFYLFDTFRGFDERDLNNEKKHIGRGFDSEYFDQEIFDSTSLDIVMSKLSNPENIIVREGYFPETTQDIDETFCFVNLDMDLYDPMYNGLEYFYNRMADGGVILLHDYFHNGLQGVKTAVKDYENKNHIVLKKMPIGDHCSLAIIK